MDRGVASFLLGSKNMGCRLQELFSENSIVLEAMDAATPPPKKRQREQDGVTPPFVKRRKGSRLPQQSLPPLSQPILRLFAVFNEMARHLLDSSVIPGRGRCQDGNRRCGDRDPWRVAVVGNRRPRRGLSEAVFLIWGLRGFGFSGASWGG